MDEKQKVKLSHFAGIIRAFVGLIIVFIVTLGFTRWAGHRRVANESAQRAARGSSKSPVTSSKSTEESKRTRASKDESAGSNQLATVPSGIDDSIRQPSSVNSSVPSAGIEGSFGITVLMITVLIYLLMYNTAQRRLLFSLVHPPVL